MSEKDTKRPSRRALVVKVAESLDKIEDEICNAAFRLYALERVLRYMESDSEAMFREAKKLLVRYHSLFKNHGVLWEIFDAATKRTSEEGV